MPVIEVKLFGMLIHWASHYALHFAHFFIVHVMCFITFHVRHSRGKMYGGHGRLCVCLSLAAFLHYCMDPDVTWGNGRGCRLVVHYWADLQSVHGFRCYDNIAHMWNVSECLYSLYAWFQLLTSTPVDDMNLVTHRTALYSRTHNQLKYNQTQCID